MKQWKKYALSGVCATMALTACFAFASCNRDSGVKNRFVVDEGNTITLSGKAGTSIEFPEATKEGYIFKGWYISSDYTGMPVTSATFDGETVYYARWAQGYEVTLDLGGGSISGYDASKKIYLEAGASISEFIKDYVPSNGEYQFGGWYVDGALIGANDRMPASGIELVAKYKAQYTVNVHVQNLDDTGYTVNDELKVTDYALIGETYSPVVTLQGFTKTTHADEVVSKTISTNKNENVYEYYFTRNKVTLTLNANYPNGSPELDFHEYRYGETVTLPDGIFSTEGCRFLGWGATPDATYADVLKDDYTMSGNDVLYAVWNVGYVDAFTGEDYIYRVFNTDADGKLLLDTGKILLSRGGVDIESSAYNETTGIYTVSGTDIDISVKLNNDGTFVYYANRQGSYVLYNGDLDRHCTIELDNADGITYSSDEEGKEFSKTGTYVVDADGMYTATLTAEDGTEETLVFVTDIAETNAGYVPVFLIRGEEYNYGVYEETYESNILFRVSNGNFYYPILTLDGFGSGSAYLPASDGGETEYALVYIVSDGVLTFRTAAGQRIYTAKFIDYNGYTLYSFYEAELDNTFENELNGATLTLDGLETATYTNGSTSLTGTYVAEESVLGAYTVTIQTSGGAYTYFIQYDGTFVEKENGYMDYRFLNEETLNIYVPFLSIEGNEGALYELNSNNALRRVSRGSIAFDGVKYVYTATEFNSAATATYKYASMTFMVETVSTGDSEAKIFYILSYKLQSDTEETQLATVYTNGDATLTVTPMFATYEDGDLIVTDMYMTIGETCIVLRGVATDDQGDTRTVYYYFECHDADKTFISLAKAPIIANKYLSDSDDGINVSETEVLTLTGRVNDGVQDAVYTNGTSTYTGTVNETPTPVSAGGLAGSYFTFTGTNATGEEKTVYFTYNYRIVTVGEGNNQETEVVYYFNEYTDVLVSLGGMAEDGSVGSANGTIALLLNGTLAYYANESAAAAAGTVTADEDYYVFDEEPFTVYTFTLANGGHFRYTLRRLTSNNTYYFMIAEEGKNVTFTADDGSTLVLDSVVHIAKYTDASFMEYTEFYFSETPVLDNTVAYSMYLNGTAYVFDVNTSAKTFTLRGTEADTYAVIANGSLTGTLELNGYGKAVLTETGDEAKEGTYEYENGVAVVTIDGKTFSGKIDVLTENGLNYNVFFVETNGFAGSYLNESDLSVLVLDSVGGAVKYDSYGVKEEGEYVVLDEGLFVYVNATGNFVYSLGANNTVVLEDYGKTFYAYDFTSIVFGKSGLVSIDGELFLYHYDAKTNTVTTYRRATEGDTTVNDYGFVSERHTIGADNTIALNGKTYKLGDGNVEFTLTGTDGSTLVFKPTGEAAFEVAGKYKASAASEEEDCIVYTTVGENGAVTVTVSFIELDYLNGSTNQFLFFSDSVLTFNADEKYTLGEAKTSLSAIDYDGILGAIQIVKDGDNYSVSGEFVFSDGSLSFKNGILSRAGYYMGDDFGHLYTCEFADGNENIWHLSFFLILDDNYEYRFVTYTLSRVLEKKDALSVAGDSDTVWYFDRFVYSWFKAITDDMEKNGPNVNVLKYKGEIICVVGEEANDDLTVYSFHADAYFESSMKQYRYDVSVTLKNGSTEVNKNTVVSADGIEAYAYEEVASSENDTDAVLVKRNADTGEFLEITVILTSGSPKEGEAVVSCEKNGNVFTATTSSGVYKVTLTVGTDDQGKETLSVTIEKIYENVQIYSLDGGDAVMIGAVRDCNTKEFTEITLVMTNKREDVTSCVKNADGTFTVTTESGTYKITITAGSGNEEPSFTAEKVTAPETGA